MQLVKLIPVKSFEKKKLEIGKILVFHSRRTGEIIPVLLHQTVCENVRLCELSSSLVFTKLLSNLATLLILRRYFQLLRRIFGNLTLPNLTKKKKHRERVYYRRKLTRSFLQSIMAVFFLITRMFFVEK